MRKGISGIHIEATAVKDERDVDLVSFSKGHQLEELADMGSCDAIYTPIINKWNGMRSVQPRVCDMRPAPIEDPEACMKDRGDKFIDAFSENILYNTGCGIDTGEKKARGLEKLMTDSIAGTMVLCFT